MKAPAADLTVLRLNLYANGYTPIPVTAPDYRHPKVTTPGKAPFFQGWQKVSHDTLNPAIVEGWTTGIPNHLNTGLLTGDMLGLDIDVPIADLSAQLQRMAGAMLGETPLLRIGNAPKALLCYRTERPLQKIATPALILPSGAAVKVEAMGQGQQVVAYGVHPDTGKDYAWPHGEPTRTPLADLPVAPEAALRGFMAAAEAVLRAAGGRTKKELEAAAAQPQPAARPVHVNGSAGKPHAGASSNFFREVNSRALANIGAWLPAILPTARQEGGTGAWRVSSADLGRALEEDISVHADGARDFGTEEPCTPIDLVMTWAGVPAAKEAAFYLCDKLGTTPAALGWKGPAAPAAEQREQEPEPTPVKNAVAFPATLLTDQDLEAIPPRPWLYGRELLRGFVSALGSTGGIGKTSLSLAVGVSIASNRPLLTAPGATPDLFRAVHKAGPVWFYNLEDPADEMRRRIKALLMHHAMTVASLPHPVYMDSGRTRPLIVTRRSAGDLIAHPVVDDLVAELKRRSIALLVVDPFLRSHSAVENSNEEMGFVMELWCTVADRANCAVWLIHHFRKGGQGGDSESFRGAASIQGAARAMSTLAAMTLEEADKLGIDPKRRKRFIRKDDAKANLSEAAEQAEWYELVSVPLGNATVDYPRGDAVQVVQPWEPPSPWDGLSWSTISGVLQALQDGPAAGEYYAAGKQAKDRWAGRVLVEKAKRTEGQAAAILKAWIDSGLLEKGTYPSPAQNGAATGCITVNAGKAAEMNSQAAASFAKD